MEFEFSGLWSRIREDLKKAGIDLDMCCNLDTESGEGKEHRVKVVCVSPDLKDSMEEMAQAPRDQVVMVRVDEATSKSLDSWVETGAVKSRSEAAALFIREGLKVRNAELDKLRDALQDVEKARERLKERARLPPSRDTANKTAQQELRPPKTGLSFRRVDDPPLVDFFFGEPLSARVREQQMTVVPECTGIWWRQI